MRRMHGPCAGPFGAGWLCGRCFLEATDLDDARRYSTGYRPSAGREWERQCQDFALGRSVDPFELAASMGRYLLAEERLNGPESPVIDLLCEVSFAASRDDWPSPWSRERSEVVAEMILTALNAGGCAVVDVDESRRDHRRAAIDAIEEVVAQVRTARTDFDGATIIVSALVDAGFALVEVP